METGFLSKMKGYKSILFLGYFLAVPVILAVYATGGTNRVFSHLMYIPIVIVSSVYGKKTGVVHAFFCGLCLGPFMPLNVVEKLPQEPFNWILRILIFMAISLIIGFFSDYDRKHREHITNLLTHDGITGLRNLESIRREENTDTRNKTMILLSVKNLEETMNFFGYRFCNHFAENFAASLEKNLKNQKNIDLYYYGGMQFIVKFSRTTLFHAESVLEDLLKLDQTVMVVDKIPIYIDMQMGITHTDWKVPAMEGLRQALTAHSYSKANDLKISYYKSDIEMHYRELLEIAGSFSGAMQSQHIRAAYQYVVHSGTEEPYAVEMLARWVKPDDQCIRPDVFVPVLEQTLQINTLTRFMISMAVDFLSLHRDDDLVTALNFAKNDFSDEILDFLFEKLADARIDSSRIRIEVVERTFTEKNELLPYLKRLHDNHIRIALDDFGAGYSSYQYLTELPVDTIKIDKSIIMNIAKSATGFSLVKSITDFCIENNIKTVAEGVETLEIAEACKAAGINFLQGYYYHEPELVPGGQDEWR